MPASITASTSIGAHIRPRDEAPDCRPPYSVALAQVTGTTDGTVRQSRRDLAYRDPENPQEKRIVTLCTTIILIG